MAQPPRGFILPLALAAAMLAAAPALAQSYNPSATTSPDLGIIVPDASSSTTFSFASSTGTVGQTGSAVRRTSGTTRAQVSIACTGGGSTGCAAAINVKIGPIGTPGGKAGALSNFNVTAVSGSITNLSASTNPLTFTITPVNKSTDASFYVGADFPIGSSASAGAFGAATSQFYVYAAKSPSTPTTGGTVTASATTYRGISFSGTPTLKFGAVSKPASGTVTVTLGPNSDTVTPTTQASGTIARAFYTVLGEGGQAVSITVPTSTITMTGDRGGTIPLTLNHTTLPTALDSSAGSQGQATFYVGGSIDVTSTQTPGNYSGSYSVTAQYN